MTSTPPDPVEVDKVLRSFFRGEVLSSMPRPGRKRRIGGPVEV